MFHDNAAKTGRIFVHKASAVANRSDVAGHPSCTQPKPLLSARLAPLRLIRAPHNQYHTRLVGAAGFVYLSKK